MHNTQPNASNMTPSNNLPTDHSKWKALKETLVLKPKLIRCLNRFQYRHKLAVSFTSMTIEGTNERTIVGYTAFMKLFLAYSAYDVVRAAEAITLNRNKPKVHNIKKNKTLAATLRKNDELKKLLIEGIEDDESTLKKGLNRFFEGTSDDILCVATAARNSFAHGDLTAGGAGLSIKAKVAAIEALATELTSYSDTLFSKCLKNIQQAQAK